MYHDVVAQGQADDSGFPGPAAGRYKLERTEFVRHLDALAASGLEFPAVTAAADRADASNCLLTFDDGGVSAAEVGDALSARGMVGHFFITTAMIGKPGFMSAVQLRSLHAAGHVLGSHSHTHPAEISRLPETAIASEWQRSVLGLQDVLGVAVTVASVPGGFYSDVVAAAAAEAGICNLFTSEPMIRVSRRGNCAVLGRYALWRGMDAATALALAQGRGTVRARQWATWNLKKPLKRLARPLYRALRERLSASSHSR